MKALHIPTPAGIAPEVIETIRAGCASEEGSGERVRALLAHEPAWVERIPSLAAAAQAAILGQVSAPVLAEEAWRAKVEAVRTSLAMPGDRELERLLIERVTLSWLAVTVAEVRRAARWQEGVPNGAVEFWDRHVSRLNADFLRASKALASVRRLRLPSVQVNVGAQQVNYAG